MSIILQCENLSKRYGKEYALSNINLTLETGRIVGLLGPNGSGKTTLIKLAAGMIMPTEGRIQIGGADPGPETKRITAYLPDKEFLPVDRKICDLIWLYDTFFPDFDRQKALDMAADLNLPENVPMKKLSKGNREKLQLILTMSRDAQLYLLDEPIGGADPAAREYILRTIIRNYSENATVVLSTHLISEVEQILDEAVFMDKGSILFHRTIDEIRQTEGKSADTLFRELYRC